MLAAVPEDGSAALAVWSTHGEAALVLSTVSADCSLSVPSTLQGAVCLGDRGRAGEHTLTGVRYHM